MMGDEQAVCCYGHLLCIISHHRKCRLDRIVRWLWDEKGVTDLSLRQSLVSRKKAANLVLLR